MKRRDVLVHLAGLPLLPYACGGSNPNDPSPSPDPGPSPSPTPVPAQPPFSPPLRVSGNQIVDSMGRNARLIGLHGCCVDPAWPQSDGYRARLGPDLLTRGSAAGFNFSVMRVGPNLWHYGDAYNVYLRVGDRVDLTQWDPDYWQHFRASIEAAGEHGFYVEIDAVDGWAVKPANFGVHPWKRSNNIQQFDCGGVNLLAQSSLPGPVASYIDKLVQQTGMYAHLVYEISNEPYVPGTLKPAFEKAIVATIRAAESKYGYIRHLIGSNAHQDAPWADFESYHQHTATGPGPRPRRVNENNPHLPAETWEATVRSAKHAGTDFDLWLSGAPDSEIVKYMDACRRLRAEGF